MNGVRKEGQIPLPEEVVTVAEIFQQAGYVTGAFGKWGLGYPGSEGDPNNQGFDHFYGYNCQTLSHNYYPYHLWENQNKIILDGNRGKQKGEYAADLIHEEALEFIHQNKNRPFFLYYPNLIPHAELDLPEKYIASFKGKFLPEKKYRGVDDGPRYKKGGYCSQQEAHAVFAAMVSLLDKQVGEIVEKLKQEGIFENTLIIFSSDNGPHQEGGADPDFFNSNGPLKGYKRDLYEGGIRVPMIVSWEGHIKEGAKTDHISAFWDFLPTVCELTGYKLPENIDGISFLPILTGKGKQKEHKYLYWEFYENDGRMAIRKGDWKLVKYNAFDKDRCKTYLYDLSGDLGETNDLSKEYSKKVTRLEQLMKDAHVDSGI